MVPRATAIRPRIERLLERTHMASSLDPKYTDKRTVERYLRSGVVDEKEYDKYLKSLPDLAENALPVEVVMDEDLDDEEVEDDQEE